MRIISDEEITGGFFDQNDEKIDIFTIFIHPEKNLYIRTGRFFVQNYADSAKNRDFLASADPPCSSTLILPLSDVLIKVAIV